MSALELAAARKLVIELVRTQSNRSTTRRPTYKHANPERPPSDRGLISRPPLEIGTRRRAESGRTEVASGL